ncbi:glycosyltransferase [Candidatus Fermentibacteria bacterium]|nr:glycosyltransferase [Candidatus Fermentibacteria bacterium]
MLLLADARAVRKHLDGIGRFSVSVIGNLDQLRPEWAIRVVADPEGAHHLTELESEIVFCDAPRFGLSERIRIPRIVREIGADAYLNFSMAGPVVPVPSILTIHDLMVLQLRGYFGEGCLRNLLSRAVFALLLKRSVRTSEAIAVPSLATRDSIGRYYGKHAERVFVTGEGQDLFDPSDPPGVERKDFLLYVGNARAYKNLPRLLASYEEALQRVGETPPLVMVVRRDRAYADFEKLLTRSPVADRVEVLSGISESKLRNLYSTCMALVMPSVCEGFGLPALEAMASGAPVLASRGTALEGVVGDAGLLVDPLSIQDISAGILKISEDDALRKNLSARALDRSKEFTWRKTAKAYAEKIEEIA